MDRLEPKFAINLINEHQSADIGAWGTRGDGLEHRNSRGTSCFPQSQRFPSNGVAKRVGQRHLQFFVVESIHCTGPARG